MANSSASNSASGSAGSHQDRALAEMINGLKEESINRGATALMDKEVDSFGVPNPRILIVGCGGSGNNTLNRITHLGVEGAVTVAINTDKQHLDHTRALQKLLVGRHITRGLGAGGDPSTGRRCAEAGREMIKRIVSGADLVFIASGLGGGSGTGICPIVAEEAKAAGALVVGIVTTPFHVERRQRMARALEGLESLRRVADAVLVLDNNRLLHYVPNLPLDEAFSIMDQLVAEIVKGIVETITLPSLINLDFADVRAIMANGGVTMMLYGESDRGPEEVVHEALNHPLLDVDISGATGVLIHVTGGQYMTLEAASQVVDLLTAKVSEDANVIWGARQDAGFGDTIKVMAIITGVGGTDLRTGRLAPDALGDALRITRGKNKTSNSNGTNLGFHRFD
ncbi:MAG: cell division protein FtsZ [Candidatus Poseidoniaceae archaeon]|nr:cell division protein FtsZ [Candidatus Poseidoniaceae archaeon]